MDSNNKKLASNIFLMFLVFFLPKVFSFFLVPVYTAYLSTEEYGVSDLIISTASLISPFVALATPSAILRYTIENKEDKRPYQISLRILTTGMLILLLGLVSVYFLFDIESSYLFFVFFIVGTSLLSDIHVSYARGMEQMKLVTICGVGSSIVSILCNILFIVVFRWGLYGFLIASASGYTFNVIVLMVANRKKQLLKGLYANRESELRKDILGFSMPLIFSGLSWWIISSSDRYFVAGMCGTAANGIYSVAYKIPTILQAVDNVFYQAWIYTLYDSYKTSDGRKYIVKVYDVYNFFFCFVGSVLIVLTCPLAKLLYSNDFYAAWRYVPFLVISTVLNSAGGLVGNFLSVYKKTKTAMIISVIAAFSNMVMNYVFIELTEDALGAAIATAFTFLVTWGLYTYQGIKCSGIQVKWKKAFLTYIVLVMQTIVIVTSQSMMLALVGLVIIILLNCKNIIWAKSKGKSLLRRS